MVLGVWSGYVVLYCGEAGDGDSNFVSGLEIYGWFLSETYTCGLYELSAPYAAVLINGYVGRFVFIAKIS